MRLRKNIANALMTVLGMTFLFPLAWMILMSFKSGTEIYVNPFGLPRKWVLTNYKAGFNSFNFLQALGNSLKYTLGTCFVTLFLGSMVAYALTRMNWRHSGKVLVFLSMGLVVPVNVVMIPLYSMINDMGLKGTALSMILPYSAFALASTVLMLHAFLRGIPPELEEAAAIDGCNVYRCFFSIIVPVIKPALITRFVLIFLNTWNEFTLAIVLANRALTRPLPVALQSFFTSLIGIPDWGVIGAVMVMASIPSTLLYTFGNRQLENALTAGDILK